MRALRVRYPPARRNTDRRVVNSYNIHTPPFDRYCIVSLDNYSAESLHFGLEVGIDSKARTERRVAVPPKLEIAALFLRRRFHAHSMEAVHLSIPGAASSPFGASSI